jgi:predicted nucleic acid-binding protein
LRTALDTNILSALFKPTVRTSEVVELLGRCKSSGPVCISCVVYAECLATPSVTVEFFRSFVAETKIEVDFASEETLWQLAGSRFARYARRRRISLGEPPRRLLADFVIGAHALLHADRLLTFDSKVFRQDFPELPLML